MTSGIDPINELREDHKKVRDYLLDFISAAENLNAQKALEILLFLDKLGGPHFRFEEETFYPALEKFFGKEYHEYLLRVPTELLKPLNG